MTYLDTHVLVWLATGEISRLAPGARTAVESGDLVASPMAILEMEFLHEIGRFKPSATTAVDVLTADLGLRICDLPFSLVAEYATKEKWVRDPFDRLIVANAKAAGAPLVTKDARILRHYSRAIW